jgi:hypothetical protein
MEFLGSGGLVLLILAVLWLSFVTPTSLTSSNSKKNKSKKLGRAPRELKATIRVGQNTTTLINKGTQASLIEKNQPEKVVIHKLPDPLSARIGSIENVTWAEVKNLDEARDEKQKINSENLDEILKRRRSIG